MILVCQEGKTCFQGFSKVAFVQRLCLCMLLFCSFCKKPPGRRRRPCAKNCKKSFRSPKPKRQKEREVGAAAPTSRSFCLLPSQRVLCISLPLSIHPGTLSVTSVPLDRSQTDNRAASDYCHNNPGDNLQPDRSW